MSALVSLLLLTALSIPTNTLVLRSGERIAVDGKVTVDKGRVLFRSGRELYSIPAGDVDLEATRETTNTAPVQPETRAKLRVTREQRDRLLRELEENHSGTAAPAGAMALPPPEQPNGDEWAWRHQARSYEEGVRRAKEDLALLQSKADALKERILNLVSLGYKPDQFTYDTTQLAETQEQIPQAQLELQRAQRAYAQFQDDANTQGILPGWVR